MEATRKRDGSNNLSTDTEVDNRPPCCECSQGETTGISLICRYADMGMRTWEGAVVVYLRQHHYTSTVAAASPHPLRSSAGASNSSKIGASCPSARCCGTGVTRCCCCCCCFSNVSSVCELRLPAMRSCDCSCKQIPNLLMHFTCLLSGGSFASSDEVMPTKQASKALLRESITAHRA